MIGRHRSGYGEKFGVSPTQGGTLRRIPYERVHLNDFYPRGKHELGHQTLRLSGFEFECTVIPAPLSLGQDWPQIDRLARADGVKSILKTR
jgi:hypothetical protein